MAADTTPQETDNTAAARPGVGKKKPRPVLIAAVAAIAGLAAAGWYFFQGREEAPRDRLRLYGNVDIRQVNLGFRVSGRLDSLLAEEGDAVKAGQLLATLDDKPYLDNLRQARAQVDMRRAELEKLRTGTRPEEIEQARALVEESEATLKNAEREFTRVSDLIKTGAATQRDLDDARLLREQAQARLHSARASLQLAEAGFRKEEIAAAQASLHSAEASLSIAETQLQDTRLLAAQDGIVLSRIVEPGAIVSAGAPVYTVSLSDSVWVRTYVSEPNLGHVHPGSRALITTDSRPEQPYLGQVGFISPVAEFTPKNVETSALRTNLVYRIRIIVTNPDQGLRQGMPVTVDLITDGSGD